MLATAVLCGAVTSLLWQGTTAADQNYRTHSYPLTAVDARAARGSVINIHVNGPVVYGLERYSLFGAEPSTTYQVTLTLYADEGCKQIAMFGEQELRFPTAALTTNGVGNGHAKAVFSAQQVAPLVPPPPPPPPGRAGPCGGSAGAERLVVRAGADSVGTVGTTASTRQRPT